MARTSGTSERQGKRGSGGSGAGSRGEGDVPWVGVAQEVWVAALSSGLVRAVCGRKVGLRGAGAFEWRIGRCGVLPGVCSTACCLRAVCWAAVRPVDGRSGVCGVLSEGLCTAANGGERWRTAANGGELELATHMAHQGGVYVLTSRPPA